MQKKSGWKFNKIPVQLVSGKRAGKEQGGSCSFLKVHAPGNQQVTLTGSRLK